MHSVRKPPSRLAKAHHLTGAGLIHPVTSPQVRLTCEENVLFPNVPEAHLEALQAEPFFAKFKINPGAGILNLVGQGRR